MSYTYYYAPTKVYFGKETELLVGQVLSKANIKKVLLHFGTQSAVKSGLLAKVEKSLDENQIKYYELGGVKPNPRLTLARQGIELVKKEDIDLVLAVGGGSALDSAKCIAYGSKYDGDVWDFYSGKAIPADRIGVGVVLTLSATGSEMSNSSVMTNDEKTPYDKFGSNCDLGRPDFAFLNPELTFTVSKYQTGSGSADIMMHTLERYFNNGVPFELTDSIAAELLKNVIKNTRIALEKPTDFEARKNLMWAGSISHNDMTEVGFNSHGDWTCHKMEHELSALFDVAHGAGLAAVWGSWARHVCHVNYERFAKLGKDVFGITDNDVKAATEKTICAMEDVFRSFGMPTRIKDLGVELTEQDLNTLADRVTKNSTITLGSFMKITRKDAYEIYSAAR